MHERILKIVSASALFTIALTPTSESPQETHGIQKSGIIAQQGKTTASLPPGITLRQGELLHRNKKNHRAPSERFRERRITLGQTHRRASR